MSCQPSLLSTALTGIESAGRFVERAVLEATKDGSRVLPLLQALPFHPSPPGEQTPSRVS